mmetsp:Transcript_4932/g.10558  ORF Transcript_4932/g.10558 Transcript_4932/m.10558 type:complete len:267 (-) Transcript_4932:247-1047(-)
MHHNGNHQEEKGKSEGGLPPTLVKTLSACIGSNDKVQSNTISMAATPIKSDFGPFPIPSSEISLCLLLFPSLPLFPPSLFDDNPSPPSNSSSPNSSPSHPKNLFAAALSSSSLLGSFGATILTPGTMVLKSNSLRNASSYSLFASATFSEVGLSFASIPTSDADSWRDSILRNFSRDWERRRAAEETALIRIWRRVKITVIVRKERVAGRLMTGSNCWMGVMPGGVGSPTNVVVVVADDVIIMEVVASWKKLLTSFWVMERDDGRS